MIKYVGVILITLSTLWIANEYTSVQKRRLAELVGFVEFISQMRIRIGCFMDRGRELARDFECEALERVGFLGALRGGASVADAYLDCKDRLSLSRCETEPLDELFPHVGEGYLSDGVRLTDKTLSELQGLAERLRVDIPKNIKLFTTLAAALSLGVIILVA